MTRWVRDASYKIVEEPAPKDAVVTESEQKPVAERVPDSSSQPTQSPDEAVNDGVEKAQD